MSPIPASRKWFATLAVIIVVIATWKVIDWRTRPPPPVMDLKAAAATPSPPSLNR